jgi:hypothetical protein
MLCSRVVEWWCRLVAQEIDDEFMLCSRVVEWWMGCRLVALNRGARAPYSGSGSSQGKSKRMDWLGQHGYNGSNPI